MKYHANNDENSLNLKFRSSKNLDTIIEFSVSDSLESKSHKALAQLKKFVYIQNLKKFLTD